MYCNGYQIRTPCSGYVTRYEWVPAARMLCAVRRWWTDPLEDAVKDQVIEDKINKIYYMSERDLHELKKHTVLQIHKPFMYETRFGFRV